MKSSAAQIKLEHGCDLTNCVCADHEGWPQRTGPWWTHIYADSPKLITPVGRNEQRTYFVEPQ